ncbi:Two-component response regulator-like APRR5 [Linum perenne]
MASWNEFDEDSDRSDESVTNTGCTGGDVENEELKQNKVENIERICNDEVELLDSEKGCNRSKRFTVSWEKLLPRMMLRVLLVEADVSTRQIVAALLRKCNYRVVAASNGLKAWEILKEKAHDIDLILTEVDLPSISGYALLSLIMEHDICKNIPVIMMSNQDAVSTVYKCILRGAADYLIKPIRRNVLRHLWQHVWRRHSVMLNSHMSITRGTGLLDKYIVQDKSSCMAMDVDAAGSKNELDGHSKIFSFDEEIQKHQVSRQNLLVVDNQARASISKDGNVITLDNLDTNTDIGTKVCTTNRANFTSEEIDFMGAAPPHQSSIMYMKNELDFYSHLDLSLRSYHSGGFEVQATEEENTLRHSSASSFTRYTGGKLFVQNSPSASVCNPKQLASDSAQKLSTITDTSCPSYGSISVPVVQNKECENETAFHEQNVVCTPRPQSPYSANRLGCISEQQGDQLSQASDLKNATLQNGDKKLDSWEDQGHISESENSSLCDGGIGHPKTNNTGYVSTCGSNSDVEQVTCMIKVEAAESNVREISTHIKTSRRSEQREAAVAKFQLKRKERCYEKKVRYESRKMVADQPFLPRVKVFAGWRLGSE